MIHKGLKKKKRTRPGDTIFQVIQNLFIESYNIWNLKSLKTLETSLTLLVPGGGSLGPRATLKPRRTPLMYSKLVQISWEFLSIYLLTKYPKKFKFFWGGAPLSAP